MSPQEIVTLILSILGPAGAAWGGVKGALNGLKFRMTRLETVVDGLDKKIDDHLLWSVMNEAAYAKRREETESK